MINYILRSVWCHQLAPNILLFKCLLFINCPFYILSMWIVDPPITSSLSSSVALPCNITPPTSQDVLLLLLFYRNESNQPLYTLDSRHTTLLSNATFYYAEENNIQSSFNQNSIPMTKIDSKFSNNNLNRRYEFQLKKPISYMHIKNLSSNDAGVYRCRTDFRHSRTINRLMRLNIIEPINSVQILDSNNQLIEQTAGPFNEDSEINFTCKTIGGNPTPKIKWKIEDKNIPRHQFDIKPIDINFIKQINKSTNNTITIKLTRSFYGQRLSCEAENESNKMQHTVQIDLNLKPDKIEIKSEQSGPLKSGEKAKYYCTASGSSKKSLISWWKSEIKEERLASLNESLRAQLFTKISDNELLEFKLQPEDHGKVLKCLVKMSTLDTFELSEYISIQVLFKPIVSLVMGASKNQEQLLEGTDLFFECNVQANPPLNKKINWLFNGKLLSDNIYQHIHQKNNEIKNQDNQSIIQNKTDQLNKQKLRQQNLELINYFERITFRNDDHSLMSIKSADRQHNGEYQCVSSNLLGNTYSELVTVDVKYTSTCKTEHTYFSINEMQTPKNITLNCPLIKGNPTDQNVCWSFVNRSSLINEYCDNNRTFTLYDLLKLAIDQSANDLNNELFNDETIINDDQKVKLLTSILDQLNNDEELQLQCYGINSAGQQQKPCTIHIATTIKPTELLDCQILNTTSNLLNVNCQLDNDNYWRIDKPINYQLDVIDEQTNKSLFKLINKKPKFELNELPPGKSLRLSILSSNRKGKSGNLSLRTTTLNPSKIWRAADQQQKNPLDSIKPAIYIGCFALILCLLFALLLILNQIRNRPKLPSVDNGNSSSNTIKLDDFNFGIDSNVFNDLTQIPQSTSNSALHNIDNEHNALNCIELLAHDDISGNINNESMFMRFSNNDYASFGKVDSNVQLVNAICLHYTPSTFNPFQTEIEQCTIPNLTPSLSSNCLCKQYMDQEQSI